MKKLGVRRRAEYIFIVAACAVFFYVLTPSLFSNMYVADVSVTASSSPAKKVFVATHVATPFAVKALYMTACVAGTPSFREKIVRFVEDTEINSLVIDVKDYSGSISFATQDLVFVDAEKKECFASDMREFIESLHKKGIYVIGRVTVFQDPIFAKVRPDLAIQKKSDKSVWKDYKGLSFIDVGAREYWDYIISLSKHSYLAGFDEINFDYIRFPSDGNMIDIYFPWSEERVVADPLLGKADVLREFFSYLYNALHPQGIAMSADLFGMTTTNTDDLNIGQIIEYALPYFDYIAPMVYPSHYPKGFIGLSNPAEKPYEVVKYSMDKAFARASTTPQKIRPWLQDFDLGAVYTAPMVRAQIQATYDAGLTSWMLWDAANTYTKEALLPQ
ncbi:MAG: putative glycoside hydrolase [Patescibacteria group bacterium]